MADVAKTCPKCAPDRLVVRRNGDIGKEFLGCSNRSAYKHTEGLPLGIQIRRQGAAQLPGF